ncbi:SdrD B-like domain-containing protein [Fibrella forsythiae]|uniref:SD-repeat containing protein B domain-containing protein n=1 Tax=Fibrella forsythiae TaxID=2817061 RepID=A0ABS3JDT4_9BACT|nr:SdrD B-like domain-containing protein [Fibrella forsythiae]MBO0948159.1 hypothetical protein [Fibrella forsythiae]
MRHLYSSLRLSGRGFIKPVLFQQAYPRLVLGLFVSLVSILSAYFIGITSAEAQTTPVVGIPCYVNGPSTGSTQDAFVGVYYNSGQGGSSLSSGASAINHLATFGQIGATWGAAYDSRVNSFYAGASLKRHSGYGPNGSGAIYRISANASSPSVSLLINLDGSSGQLPNGTFITINTGAAADHGSLGTLSTPGSDNPAFALAGKTALGDIDISPTKNTLWVVNAADRQLIEVNISDPASPSVGKVYPITTPSTGVTPVDGQLRPWGLEVAADGSVFIGVVASAEAVTPATPTTVGPINLASTTPRESIANRAKLVGYVFKLDKITGTFTQVVSINLNYTRGYPGVGSSNTAEWLPWYDNYATGFPNVGDGYFQLYPQPLIAGMEILDDGSMLISIMDRFGLQTGSEGNSKPGTTNTDERVRATGDVVRVLPSGAGWSSTISQTYGDIMSNLEDEAALGGIAYQSGTNEFLSVTVDPVNANSNGLSVIGINPPSLIDNQDLVSYAGAPGVGANPLLGSKGLALGDIEIGTVGTTTVCSVPSSITANTSAPTCSSLGVANNDGQIILNEIANADRFAISEGSTYTATTTYASASAIVGFPTTLVSTIPNIGGTYTVRFFNGSGTCFTDQTFTIAAVTCTPPACNTPTIAISAAQTICQGSSFTLPLSASVVSGTATSQQWFLTNATGTSFTAISGATSLTFTPTGTNLPTATGGIKYFAFRAYNFLTTCATTAFVSLTIKPTQAIAFTAPSATTVTQCAATPLILTVNSNATAPDAIRFVYFTSPQSGTAMYTGGTDFGTVTSTTVVATKAVSLTTVVPPNTTTGTLTYYVYALLESADDACKPVDGFVLTITPKPIAVIGGATTVCQGTSTTLTLPPGLSYRWSTGATTRQITPVISATTTSAVYSATLTSIDGCVSDPATFTVTGVACTSCIAGAGQVGGTIYNDFDASGTQTTAEPGLSGITVNIYACDANGNSTLAGTTTTDFIGNYFFSGLTDGVTYRVEFSNVPARFEQSAWGANSGTSVQFVKSPSCGVSLGLSDPTNYCAADAPVAVVCFARNTDGVAEPTIITVSYADGTDFVARAAIDATKDWATPTGVLPLAAKATIANVGDVATTFGLTWDKTHKQAFTGAYARAFAPMKTAANGFGEGVIYKIKYANGSATTPGVWLDLETVLGAGVSGTFVTDATFPAADVGGLIGNNSAKIGYTGLGSMRMASDDSELYVVNLNKLEVLVIPVDAAGAPVTAQLKRFPLPTDGCPTGSWSDGRPYRAALGLGVHPATKRVYATLTCTGPTLADLKGLVYSFDPSVASPSASDFRLETTVPLNTSIPATNPNVNPWYEQTVHAWDVFNTPGSAPYTNTSADGQHTQPWLGEVEFDQQPNGQYGMLLSTRNRYHDLINESWYVTGGTLQRVANTGTDASPTWALESNAVVGDQVSTVNWTLNGATNAGGNTSLTSRFFKYVGREGTMLSGTMDYVPGRPEIILPAMDNVYHAGNSGITWLNRTTGERSQDIHLLGDNAYSSAGYYTLNFPKANNWGGLVVLCTDAPIQIGNRVWRDDNQNGIQDPCEPAIPGAVVKLYDAAKTTVIASATTNAAGEYYFSSATVAAGTSTSSVSTSLLQYNTTYALVITSLGTGTVVSGLSLADVSPLTPGESGTLNSGTSTINNDAILDAGKPCIKLTTGGPGAINHTYDFGIVKAVCSLTATAQASSQMVCTGLPVTLTAAATPVGSYTYAWSAPAGVTLTSANTATATATASVSGLQTFSVTVSSSPACFTTATVSVSFVVCTVPPASLGDKVFADVNRNGVYDAGDAPIAGVTVTLISSGTVVAVTTTASSGTGIGCYSFTGLTPGVPYSVSFTTPAGYTATTPLSSTDTTIDSNPINGISAPVTLTAGENNPTIDAGYVLLPASLGDYVWFDTNGNGQQDPGESGVTSVTAVLCDAASDSVISTTVTDGAGKYLFTELNPGSYIVKFTAPTGTTFTTPNSGTDATDSDVDSLTGTTGSTGVYSLTAGEQNLTVDAGLIPLLGSLGDYVWKDINNNGVQDVGEPGTAGVTVQLYQVIGGVIGSSPMATTVTSSSGLYGFTNLASGNYQVKFILPGSLSATCTISPKQNVGSDDAKDSDVNPLTGLSQIVTIDVTQPTSSTARNNPTVDMALLVKPSVALLDPCQCFQVEWNLGEKRELFELVAVTAPSGESWSVVAQTNMLSLDTLVKRPVMPGTLLTETPVGSGKYELGFTFEDGADYSLTVTNGTDVLTIGNSCSRYPDYLTTIISQTMCRTDAPVSLTAIADQPGTAKFFYVDKNTKQRVYITQFDPARFNEGDTIYVKLDLQPADVTLCGSIIVQQVLISSVDCSTLGSIGDLVWKDVVQNGRYDTGTDLGVPNVMVRLFAVTSPVGATVVSTSLVSTTVTNGTGNYLFPNLPAGRYVVEFDKTTIPTECTLSPDYKLPGVGDTLDSDVDPNTGRSPIIEIIPGDPLKGDVLTVDAALINPACQAKCVPIVVKRLR